MSNRRSATVMTNYCESGVHSYDYSKAIEVKTKGLTRPNKGASLLDFSKAQSRGSSPMIMNESFSNVLLENTKDERKREILKRKRENAQYSRFMDRTMM